MGVVFRQSIKSSIIYFSGAILGALSTYLMAQVFAPTEAGITRNLITQAIVLQTFLTLGMHVVLTVYIPRYAGQHQKLKALNTIAMLLPLAAGLIMTIPYFLCKGYIVSRYQLQDQRYIRQYYAWMPFFVILWAYISMLEMYLMSQMKIAISSFMREILLRIVLILLIVAYYFQWISLHYFVIFTIVAHILPVIGLLAAAMKTPDFGLTLSLNVFSREEIKEIASFAWYHLLNGITIYLMGYLDALILASQSPKGLGDAQIYSVVIFFATFLTLPYRSMTNASTQKLNEAYHQNDMPLVKSLFLRTSDNMLIGVFAMWLLIIPNMHNAEALLNDNYKGITLLVIILSIGKVADIITGPNSELIGLSRHYKFLFRVTILLVIGIVVFDRIFIPKYGILAAAWVTATCTVAYNIIKMIYLYAKMNIHTLRGATFKIVACAAITAIPALLLPALKNPFLDTFYRTVIIIPVYVVLLYILKASPDLNSYLQSIKKNKRFF